MKNLLKYSLGLFAMLSLQMQFGYGQACGTLVSSLSLNTGFNHSAGSGTLGTGTNDAKWQVVQSSALVPAVVINTPQNTNTPPEVRPTAQAGSRWISTTFPPPIPNANTIITYRYIFCLNNTSTIPSGVLNIYADDEFQVYLNGKAQTSGWVQGPTSGNPAVTINLTSTDFISSATSNFNFIDVKVKNLNTQYNSDVETGLNITGSITKTNGITKWNCACTTGPPGGATGSTISGYVFEDKNRNGYLSNGIGNPIDGPIHGFKVELRKSQNPSQTPFDDFTTYSTWYSYGNYQFTNVPPGVYYLSLDIDNTWYGDNYVLTAPTNNEHVIVVPPNTNITDKNFGLTRAFYAATMDRSCTFDNECKDWNVKLMVVDEKMKEYASSFDASFPTFLDDYYSRLLDKTVSGYYHGSDVTTFCSAISPCTTIAVPDRVSFNIRRPDASNIKYNSVNNANSVTENFLNQIISIDLTKNDLAYITNDGGNLKAPKGITGNGTFTKHLYWDQNPQARTNCCPAITFNPPAKICLGNIELSALIGAFNCTEEDCCLDEIKWSVKKPGQSTFTVESTGNSKFNYNFNQFGTYEVKIEFSAQSGGCTDVVTKSIEVLDPSDITVSGLPTELCVGESFGHPTLSVTINAPNNSLSLSDYQWKWGDDSSPAIASTNTTKSYSSPGTKNVNLDVITSNPGLSALQSCLNAFSAQIDVKGVEIDFDEDNICLGADYQPSPNAVPSGYTMSNYTWDFGGLATSNNQNPTYQFMTAGTYTVTLTADVSGCTAATATKEIDVIDGGVTYTAPTDICVNNNSANIVSTNIEPLSASLIYGDGSAEVITIPSGNPINTTLNHTYTSSGSFITDLEVIFSSNCTTKVSKTVDVDAPIVSFLNTIADACQDENYVVGHVFTLSPLSKAITATNWFVNNVNEASYNYGQLSFGRIFNDLTDPNDPNEIKVQISYPGCTVEAIQEVHVLENIDKNVNVLWDYDKYCLGDDIEFKVEGDIQAADLLWNFGNGETSTNVNPKVRYDAAGPKNVTLNVTYTESCVNDPDKEFSQTIHVEDYEFCTSCEECISSFKPQAGDKYVLSAWVKESDEFNKHTYTDAGISLVFEGTAESPLTHKAKGPIIDGWQQIEEEFIIPSETNAIRIELVNEGSQDVYFDDIRIFPFNANMKSFVYDPINMQLKAELDENNYATFYEYDEDGNLIRVKKETERGVMTIQESVKRSQQK